MKFTRNDGNGKQTEEYIFNEGETTGLVDYNLQRLTTVFAYVCGYLKINFQILGERIFEIEDNEGTLRITWRDQPSARETAAFDNAWLTIADEQKEPEHILQAFRITEK